MKPRFIIKQKTVLKYLICLSLTFPLVSIAQPKLQTGTDLNSAQSSNAAITELFSANRGSNGGGDQSLQFGDVLYGGYENDVLVGGLGIDILLGYAGDDVLIGGTEDFNPFNRDRAMGGDGYDSFIWAPGDGNDFFDGGNGVDVLIMGVIGENPENPGYSNYDPVFSVNPPNTDGSGDFDGVFINPQNGLPVVRVATGPGFCEIEDVRGPNATELEKLGVDQLIRFVLRAPRDAFEAQVAADPTIDPDTLDTGLRIAVHLKNTEYLACASREGGLTKVFDLTQYPAKEVDISELPAQAYSLIVD